MIDKKTFVTIIVIIIIVLGVSSIYWFTKSETKNSNNNNEDNLALINAEVISAGNLVDLADEIEIYNLSDNDLVQSPLEITGQAKGEWFQEGEFSVRIVTQGGLILSDDLAVSSENWMNEDFVEFEAILEFEPGVATRGYVYFTKSNPSGLEENKTELKIPIKFDEGQ